MIPKPSVIYIKDFDVTQGDWRVDRQGKELEEFKVVQKTKLTEFLMERLAEIAPVKQYDEANKPTEGLMITGHFTVMEQGSRALRMFIGSGTGATKLNTYVKVYDLSKSTETPIATFDTGNGSGMAQGLGSHGLHSDLVATSREIREELRLRIK